MGAMRHNGQRPSGNDTLHGVDQRVSAFVREYRDLILEAQNEAEVRSYDAANPDHYALARLAKEAHAVKNETDGTGDVNMQQSAIDGHVERVIGNAAAASAQQLRVSVRGVTRARRRRNVPVQLPLLEAEC